MEKPAPVAHPVHDLIRRRWSPRAFSERPVEPDALRSLFEAARWAPSSFNEQPWSFIVATRDAAEAHERMLSCLTEGNRRWAEAAPVLMLSVAKLPFTRTGERNRHALHDVGLATGHLMLQATALGLFMHAMAGIHIDRACEVYEIPGDHTPVAGIAVGYAGDPERLPDRLRQREHGARKRKPIGAFVFSGRWGDPDARISGDR